VTYLPGEVIGGRMPWPGWAFSDEILVQVGRWLRRLHDVTADFRPPAGERWFTGARMGPGMVVGHQDAAPYNAVVAGGRLVGFFDWDTAGPSPREVDLAFSALSWVPLYTPGAAEHLGFREPGDRSRRLHLLLDAPVTRRRSRCCRSRAIWSCPPTRSRGCRRCSGSGSTRRGSVPEPPSDAWTRCDGPALGQ
jgi:hypothetical protein